MAAGAHHAIFLLLPDARRSRIRQWLALALAPDAPRPVRRWLSRLGRAVVSDSGVRFVACDIREANNLTVAPWP